ncbi:MAG: cytochrome c-type biogenesis protein CcmH [Ktedonobacteraceae bacterium]
MKQVQRRPLFIALAALAIVGAVWSFVFLQNPPQPSLDQRVHDVASQLRCPVCQGESVADSPSQLSQQMRGVIRQQLQSGKSEQQVIQYFRTSYGDQIVWSPPWQGFTLLAWLVPIGLLLAGLILLFFVLRDWRALAPASSTAADPELASVDEVDLAFYRAQLEQELAADDPIFAPQNRTEAG